MRRVYILTDGGHDYSQAEKYGEIVFCLDHSVDVWNISKIFQKLAHFLSDANPDDYIMVSGLTSLCMVATAIMVERFQEVHLLMYKDDRYIAKDLYLGNID